MLSRRVISWRSLSGSFRNASRRNFIPSTQLFATSGDNTGKRSTWAKWPKRIAYSVGAASLVFCLDLWANDDLDEIAEYFRVPLPPDERKNRPKIVILGGGWAALSMLRKLHTDKFDVTIISPKNYFLFTPLLPGTTTGRIELRSIMAPIREFCDSKPSGADFIEAECVTIDPIAKTVKCQDVSAIKGAVDSISLSYDHLVVAVGAEPATFGVPGVREHAVFMKEISDSRTIRDRILDCFETASFPQQTGDEINRLLHFVVVGGGPSGVEYTSELNDFLLDDLNRHFPKLTKHVKITLIEALPHILSVFDAKLIDYVEHRFKTYSNVEVLTNTAVTKVEDKALTIKHKDGTTQNVPYGTLVWVTGNAPRAVVSDLIKQLPQTQTNRRGLVVDDYFRVAGADGIWALGDCTVTKLPATAQVASQQGRYLARLFNTLADDMYADKRVDHLALPVVEWKKQHAYSEPNTLPLTSSHSDSSSNSNSNSAAGDRKIVSLVPGKLSQLAKFQYHHFGSFAYVGEHTAVAEFQRSETRTSTGLATFLFWRSVYITKLLSVKNRVLVAFDWAKTAIFGRDISRG